MLYRCARYETSACTKGMNMIGDRRSQKVLGIPEQTHLRTLKEALMDYRGRMSVSLDNSPGISIFGKVIRAKFDRVNQRVILFMNLRIKGGEQITADFYPKQIRDYYITGIKEDSPISFEHCPAKAMLLDF